ncbi:MAG: NADH-quinone oxidoreductase subunit NuoK [Proteobacteria bacterium]|nr:MAG: NADH-quinone oxidoreductase subunit NuoK [Pseudomonadota bacterium]
MITIHSYTFVAMVLFCIGILGVVSRKNIFVIYMSIELMLNAVNLILVAVSRYYQHIDGQVMAMLVIAIAAAEAAVFLSIIVVLFRYKKSLDSDVFNVLRQRERR